MGSPVKSENVTEPATGMKHTDDIHQKHHRVRDRHQHDAPQGELALKPRYLPPIKKEPEPKVLFPEHKKEEDFRKGQQEIARD